MNSDLPSHSLEKKARSHASWTGPFLIPIPGVRTRRLRIYLPNAAPLIPVRLTRVRRKRGPLLILLVCLAILCTFTFTKKSFQRPTWTESPWIQSEPYDPPTLIFQRPHLQRIWKWEVASGHYPSREPIPAEIRLREALTNPAIPRRTVSGRQKPYVATSEDGYVTEAIGTGAKRVYLDIQSQPPNVAYPPRPVPGSVADMDIIMKHCDFSKGKYVRDCLEMLRIGGGLDNGNRFRRETLDDFRYIYIEQPDNTTVGLSEERDQAPLFRKLAPPPSPDSDINEGLVRKEGVNWEAGIDLPQPAVYRPTKSLPSPCDPENPRIFHMFWTGPFTDKPYLALLSFLYSQNTGIHLKNWPADAKVCRPQFWLWINPGPAASVPNPNAVRQMYNQLKANPWASPFLHPRFKDVIQFKMWNTTEQLDSIPEIRDEWKMFKSNMFNSGGTVVGLKEDVGASNSTEGEEDEEKKDDDLANRAGTKSEESYDRLSVILSDMARFVLCHRFGGIYLDADTILLRDWEELWGWTGGFAYRWSRLNSYNTAVLRMNKGSAMGTFLFRSALRGGLHFHPMAVSRYTIDAHLEPLLLRLPDALFDAAWLNTENYQRDRPPQPYFTEFSEFFEPSAEKGAMPHALGLRGFFRGSYSYHFHNFWWKPFDPSRNFPDLGPRFKDGEEAARAALRKEKYKALVKERLQAVDTATLEPLPKETDLNEEEPEPRDLSWSTVIKRTFEAYLRGEAPNMYGEWIQWIRMSKFIKQNKQGQRVPADHDLRRVPLSSSPHTDPGHIQQMFNLIRRISYGVIPRPDRPWEEDPTSNAPQTGRKRRLSSTERHSRDDADQANKKARGESATPSVADAEGSLIAAPQVDTQEVKDVTQGVKEVDLDGKASAPSAEEAASAPENVPLPDAKSGELDELASDSGDAPAEVALEKEGEGETVKETADDDDDAADSVQSSSAGEAALPEDEKVAQETKPAADAPTNELTTESPSKQYTGDADATATTTKD
ncbi:hypothetical protein JR316_0013286 [Psilocybe cubensis]|uniref:Uncharacterized protein n=3 Tax=Psilocybe cubensis TaxID=181762 RepID=A0ACB8GGI0_PSICU|nr:hypothetical protein JR316_0013286 [Psilocybe cubensis]KAH9474820.1 hypothetical protein JR316_0013286 [Psilocybe cubensis]